MGSGNPMELDEVQNVLLKTSVKGKSVLPQQNLG